MTREKLYQLLFAVNDYYGDTENFIERGGLEVVLGIYGAWLGTRDAQEEIIREIRTAQLEAVHALTTYEDKLYREGQPKQWYRIALFLLTTDAAKTPLPYGKPGEVLDPRRTREVKPGELIEAFTALGRYFQLQGPHEQLERGSIHVWSEVADSFHNLMQLEGFDVFVEGLVLERLEDPDDIDLARELITDLRNTSIQKYKRRYVNPDRTLRREKNRDLLGEEIDLRDMMERYDMDYSGLVNEHWELMAEMLYIIRDVLEEMMVNVVHDCPEIAPYIVTREMLEGALNTGAFGPELYGHD